MSKVSTSNHHIKVVDSLHILNVVCAKQDQRCMCRCFLFGGGTEAPKQTKSRMLAARLGKCQRHHEECGESRDAKPVGHYWSVGGIL